MSIDIARLAVEIAFAVFCKKLFSSVMFLSSIARLYHAEEPSWGMELEGGEENEGKLLSKHLVYGAIEKPKT